MNPVWLAGGIFLITYALIVTERVHRTVSALLGGMAMILLGVLSQEEAFHAIDWNVIFLLAGMMVIANVLRETGLFQWIAIQAVKLGRGRSLPHPGHPLDGDRRLLGAPGQRDHRRVGCPGGLVRGGQPQGEPIALSHCRDPGVQYRWYRDPRRRSAQHPHRQCGRHRLSDLRSQPGPDQSADPDRLSRAVLVSVQEGSARRAERCVRHRGPGDRGVDHRQIAATQSVDRHGGRDRRLSRARGLASGTGDHRSGRRTILLLWGRSDPHHILREVEWTTLVFFIGLFITVEAVVQVGIIEAVAEAALRLTGGSLHVTSMLLLWFSALASGIVDNIPYTATMIPIVENLGQSMPIMPLWWSLALGACLGGNATLVGAAANVVVANLAEKSGHPISFKRFLGYGLVTTVMSLLLATGYVWLRYL